MIVYVNERNVCIVGDRAIDRRVKIECQCKFSSK